jgi:hypothetical protein
MKKCGRLEKFLNNLYDMASISKSVNDYYEYKRYQIERIDKFIKENLTFYATKHKIDIAKVIELFEKGMHEMRII